MDSGFRPDMADTIEPASDNRDHGHTGAVDAALASAGGWRSTDTLLRCYTQVDEATMFKVVSETRKVRAAGKQLEH
jgi:hypothetical protein